MIIAESESNRNRDFLRTVALKSIVFKKAES